MGGLFMRKFKGCFEPGTILYLDNTDNVFKYIIKEETMNRKEFDEFIQNFITEQSNLMKTKGKDYAGDADVLTNFKRIADNIGLSPLEAWYVYASKHWDAITTFVKTTKVTSESIRGRFIDMSNYLLLGMAIIEMTDWSKSDFDKVDDDVKYDEGKEI